MTETELPAVHWLTQTPSTFGEVDPAAPEWSTWATLDQTAGRGRRGRSWQTHAGEALAACVLVRPNSGLSWLPLLAGLALARTLEPLVEHPVGVKWPNDVQINIAGQWRKVSGILCEFRDGAVAIGFGVNLVQSADALIDTAVSLRQAGAAGSALELAEGVLDGVRGQLVILAPGLGTDALREQIESACTTLGLEVRADLGQDRAITGRALRLDQDGGLIIATSQGEHTVVAGDVVHLRPQAWQSAEAQSDGAD